jgi:hypothetical protein
MYFYVVSVKIESKATLCTSYCYQAFSDEIERRLERQIPKADLGPYQV